MCVYTYINVLNVFDSILYFVLGIIYLFCVVFCSRFEYVCVFFHLILKFKMVWTETKRYVFVQLECSFGFYLSPSLFLSSSS